MTCSATEPVSLLAALIRCPSVTPEEGGALTLLEGLLSPEGFRCTRVDRNGVPNLYARFGDSGPVLGFNGHTDVVPPGPRSLWSADPFGGEIRDGMVWGRGAVDMKSGLAAFVAAAVRRARAGAGAGIHRDPGYWRRGGRGPGRHRRDPGLDAGERARSSMPALSASRHPPSVWATGSRSGGRGSASFRLTARGRAGHSAYPERANNPVPAVGRLASLLSESVLDTGNERFAPSGLVVTGIETRNPAANVIPETVELNVNIRFNDLHTTASLTKWMGAHLGNAETATGVDFALEVLHGFEAFFTERGPFVEAVREAVTAHVGAPPELSTSGGTSDAPVSSRTCARWWSSDFVGKGMHETDEARTGGGRGVARRTVRSRPRSSSRGRLIAAGRAPSLGDDMPARADTPMMRQYWSIKDSHPDALLFYRMGDFYELFFEDAKQASESLDIALTTRGKHLGEDVPMCGVPVHSATNYLLKLIQAGHRVAVCEQTEDPEEARKRGSRSVVRREVVRVVTPGTLTEDSLLEAAPQQLSRRVERDPRGRRIRLGGLVDGRVPGLPVRARRARTARRPCRAQRGPASGPPVRRRLGGQADPR